MGWAADVDESVKELKENATDKRQLIETFLFQRDGSLVAEGMVMVVEEQLPNGEEILARFANDKRWNYWLFLNDEFSKVCLLAWKLKKGEPLTNNEKGFLPQWKDVLRKTFKVKNF